MLYNQVTGGMLKLGVLIMHETCIVDGIIVKSAKKPRVLEIWLLHVVMIRISKEATTTIIIL